MPFKAVNLLANQNTVTVNELKKTKFLYGFPKVISGHSINPMTFEDFRSVYPKIRTFTIFRDPCARLISNYLHDRTRGVWDGNLEDYISIPWKQNYLLRFFGGGNPDNGLSGYNKIDFKISVKNINKSFPYLVYCLGLPISSVVEKKNSFQQNQSQIPPDICVENGIVIGSYSIDSETHQKMMQLNQRDIDFYEMMLREEEIWLEDSYEVVSNSNYFNKSFKLLTRLEWIYRNCIYKPIVIGRLGYHALPRNAHSPDLTSSDNAF